MAQVSDTTDEVSIADILSRIWRGRGWILFCAAIGVVIAAIYITASAVRVNRPVVYYIDLNGITNERYPGGAQFSPQNLVAPEVLSEIRKRFNIDPNIKLREAFTAAYGSPIIAGMQRYYQRRLEARNLSQTDLAAINAEYDRELRAAIHSSIQIDINHSLIGLDTAAGMAIARALPEVWTEVYSTRFNIFADDGVTPVVISEADEKMGSVASVLIVDAALSTMRKGLKRLGEDNRFSALITKDNVSIAALAERLSTFDSIYFGTIKAVAFQSKDGVGVAYTTVTRQRLAELMRNVAQYDTALDKLLRPRPSTLPADGGAMASKDGLQLGESGISEILQLADRASSNAFIHETLEKRQEMAFEASALQKELDIVTSEQGIADLGIPREQATAALKELVRQYNELLARADASLRTQFKSLYTPSAGPFVPGSFLPGWAIPALFAAGATGGLLGIFVALFARRRSSVDAV
jgi:hypothetical protein